MNDLHDTCRLLFAEIDKMEALRDRHQAGSFLYELAAMALKAVSERLVQDGIYLKCAAVLEFPW